MPQHRGTGPLQRGTNVEVRCSFDGAWSTGFEIEQSVTRGTEDLIGYRLKRLSDGALLPIIFPVEDVAPSRRGR